MSAVTFTALASYAVSTVPATPVMQYMNCLSFLLWVATATFRSNCQAFVAPHRQDHRGKAPAVFTSSQESVPSCIESPVLKQVYPFMIKHMEEYGNPNIPLGNSQGRQCETLRRLQVQQKLTPEEVSLLQDLGFRFDSLEDVYEKVDFNEMFQRILSYKDEYEAQGYQIPKKFARDPELGAYVTGLRRLGPTGVDPAHARALEEIGFVWKSNRKCGSKFMTQWRVIRDRVQAEGNDVLQEQDIQKWVQAQRDANISETRGHYMAQLFGSEWRNQG